MSSRTEPNAGRSYRTRQGDVVEVLTIYWDRILIRHDDGRVEVIDDTAWSECRASPLPAAPPSDRAA